MEYEACNSAELISPTYLLAVYISQTISGMPLQPQEYKSEAQLSA